MNKNTLLLCVLLIGTGSIFSGCTVVRLSARAARPVYLNTPQQGDYQVVSHIEKKMGLCFDDTIDVTKAFVDQLTASENDAVINTSVTVKKSFGDFLINFFTLGLANCKTAYVEGDVIQYKKPQ